MIFFTKHEKLGASSRYRSIQYFPLFKESGLKVKHLPLFTDKYLKKKYRKDKTPKLVAFYCILKRVALAFYYLVNRKPILVIEKELVPYFPPIIEWLYFKTRRQFYLDYDDAVWHNYDQSENKFIRKLLHNKHRLIISWANGVSCGSDYIQCYALESGAKTTIKLPTVIDIDLYDVLSNKQDDDLFVIGWIGSPSSSQYLSLVDEPLRLITQKYNAIVHLIGVDEKIAQSFTFNHKIIKWSSATENAEMSSFNIGIMPLKDSLFERGKCSFKLIQYMGMGKPVVCSPVGENAQVVKHEINGFHAVGCEQWFNSIESLLKETDTCIAMGIKGRALVESYYSLQVQYTNYLKFIDGNS